MKNYEEMSDFEINKRVFKAIVGEKPLGYPHNADGRSVGDEANGNYRWYDYCNNPDDAWPIIVKYEIDVIQNNGQDCPLATNSAVMMFRGDDVFICQHENPLRAAMIVFLMMNEDEL